MSSRYLMALGSRYLSRISLLFRTTKTTAMTDRRRFANLVRSGQPILAPVALDPLSARLVESLGFEAAYLSGGGFGFQLAVSEALLTITEVTGLTRQIAARSEIALIADGGVGFGDALHATRAVRAIERCAAYREAGANVLMLFASDPAQIAEAGRVLGGLLSMMAPADRLDRAELVQHGFTLLIDPLTGQVAAYGAMRDAYRNIAEGGTSGRGIDELMSLYRDIQRMAGMDDLYAIEQRTTVRPASRISRPPSA